MKKKNLNYETTVQWIYEQLPVYQRDGKKAFKKDLNNIRSFCNYLNNPQNNFSSVHIAGTNGKGSTAHMIGSVLIEAGYKVGLYTSPHLLCFRERIKINNILISKSFVVRFINSNYSFIKENSFSFFELSVAMAFEYFSHKNVNVAIIETGLGGRLDSTNIINPILSVITNIGLDHTDILGETRSKIAIEKAGIIKNNVPVVVGQNDVETNTIFKRICSEKNAPLYFTNSNTKTYKSDLYGFYQKENIKSSSLALEMLKPRYPFSDLQIKNGFLNITKNTSLIGRWQILQNNPLIICDVGHNKEAFSFIVKQLKSLKVNGSIYLLVGFVKGKDVKSILKLIPKHWNICMSTPNIFRGLPLNQLSKIIDNLGVKYKIYESVVNGFYEIKQNLKQDDVLFVGGSTFVVTEVLKLYS